MPDDDDYMDDDIGNPVLTPPSSQQNLDSGTTADDLVNGFQALDLGIQADAYLISVDRGRNRVPDVYTYGDYRKKFKEPKVEDLKSDKVCVMPNSGYHEGRNTAFAPVPVFVNSTPVPANVTRGKEGKGLREALSKYKWKNWTQIARKVGIPTDCPSKGQYNCKGTDRKYKTVGGERETNVKYEKPFKAGMYNPDVIALRDGSVIGTVQRIKGGDEFTGKDMKTELTAKFGEDATFVFKSSTHVYTSEAQLRKYDERAPERRWAAAAGERDPNNRPLHPVVVVSQGSHIAADHVLNNYPNSNLTQALKSGDAWAHVRVTSPSGASWVSAQFAMEKWPDRTAGLLKEYGLPESLADKRGNSDLASQVLGKTLPPVSVPITDYRYGAPEPGEDVIGGYDENQIVIAGRDKNGERTGYSRTLQSYREKNERLPDDAAKALDVSPYYTVSTERLNTRDGNYQPRPRGRGAEAMGL